MPGSRLAGRVLPVRHRGSVDAILEVLERAKPRDILVVDNDGRRDEGCLGDLLALEARGCGLAGIVIWGCHRDTSGLVEIGCPVFSYGAYPAGPRRPELPEPDAAALVRFGTFSVGKDDLAFADDDGVLFLPEPNAGELLATARAIWRRERQQAAGMRAGVTLRQQLAFDSYLATRDADPSYTFRRHLRIAGGAIEE